MIIKFFGEIVIRIFHLKRFQKKKRRKNTHFYSLDKFPSIHDHGSPRCKLLINSSFSIYRVYGFTHFEIKNHLTSILAARKNGKNHFANRFCSKRLYDLELILFFENFASKPIKPHNLPVFPWLWSGIYAIADEINISMNALFPFNQAQQ